MGVKLVNILRAGRLRYQAGLDLQNAVRDRVRTGADNDTLIVLEHNPVYTVGLRDKSYTKEEEEKLKKLRADFHRTDRGGLITFHGPGQLVVYPILDLRRYKPSVRWYVASLEKTIIQLCRHYGLNASPSIHTGVWVDDKKICAIGIHGSRYITTHGLALNCNTDLTWFSHIVPCGIPDKTVTSLSEQLNRDVTISDTFPNFINAFEDVFDAQCTELGTKETENVLKT